MVSKTRFMIVFSDQGRRVQEGEQTGSKQGKQEFQNEYKKFRSVAVLAAADGRLGCGRLWSAGSGIQRPFGLIQAEMPGIPVDQVASAARRMSLGMPPGPSCIRTPPARRDATLRRNATRLASAELTNGRTTVMTRRLDGRRGPNRSTSKVAGDSRGAQAILSCSSPKSAISLRVPPRAET